MFWVDHVLKHRGASHLTPASAKLSWFKLYSLDVIAVLVISCSLILYFIKVIATCTVRKLMFIKDEIHLTCKISQKINVKRE